MSVRNPVYECPSCGGHCHFIDTNGFIVCTFVECKNPVALHELIKSFENHRSKSFEEKWRPIVADIISKVGSAPALLRDDKRG